MRSNGELVEQLVRDGEIRTERVRQAFLSVDRAHFVPGREPREAYSDNPLPTFDGQTISAPHMVAIMAEELFAEEGMKVLEIGGGSGYHAAVIGRLVGPTGSVVSVERISRLSQWGKENLLRAGVDNVTMVIGDGSKGYPKGAPYDRIYYTCAAPDVPEVVIGQLREGGIILAVVGPAYGTQRLVRLTKRMGGMAEEKLTYCVFVPLIGEHGYPSSYRALGR